MDILGMLGFALSVVVGLVILVILVAMHEFGHGVVARRNSVRVEEFGIGFPPRAKAWTVKQSVLGKNVEYSLNWLPLGGFVKLQGEHDAANKKGDYGAATFWQKTKILLAGIAVNWVTAAVLLTVLAATSGVPKLLPNQLSIASDTQVLPQPVLVVRAENGMPAAQAGLQKNDRILTFDKTAVLDAGQLVALAKNATGRTVDVTYERDGVEKTTKVTLRSDNSDGRGFLGLASGQTKPTMYRSTWSAPLVGIGLTGQFTAYTFESLGQMLIKLGTGLVEKVSFDGATRASGDQKLGEVGDSVGGPVAILGVLFPSAQQAGLTQLVMVTALISLTLAVMNFLPIPGLDGGRWFVTLLYRKILRRPLDKEKEEKIHGTGMMVLFALFIIITIADVWKLGS